MFTFLCYAREDRAFVERLYDDLVADGQTVWLDQRDIAAGDRWDEAVEAALSAAKQLYLVLSPDAVQSKAVLDEVAYALDEGKRIVPILCRPCKVPLRIRRLQHIDFTGSYEAGIAHLRGHARVAVPAPPPAETGGGSYTPPPPPPLPPDPLPKKGRYLWAFLFGALTGITGVVIGQLRDKHLWSTQTLGFGSAAAVFTGLAGMLLVLICGEHRAIRNAALSVGAVVAIVAGAKERDWGAVAVGLIFLGPLLAIVTAAVTRLLLYIRQR